MHKMDHKIVIVSLGGSDYINAKRGLEVAELKRLGDNVYAIVDGERSAPDGKLEPEREGEKRLPGNDEMKFNGRSSPEANPRQAPAQLVITKNLSTDGAD